VDECKPLVNGTFSKDFDFNNFKCSLPSPESFTRGAWALKACESVAGCATRWAAVGHGTVGRKSGLTMPGSTTSCPDVVDTTAYDMDSTQADSFLNGPVEQCSSSDKWCTDGRAVLVQISVESARNQRLKLIFGKLLSSLGYDFNLRR